MNLVPEPLDFLFQELGFHQRSEGKQDLVATWQITPRKKQIFFTCL